MDENSQFDWIYSAIASRYPAVQECNGASRIFQFAASPLEASWHDGNDLSAYNMADSVPTNLGGFYTPSASGVHQAYKSLLASLKSPSDTDPEVRRKQVIVDGIQKNIATEYTKIGAAFDTWKQANPDSTQTVQQWLAAPGYGAQFQATLDNYNSKLERANDDLADAIRETDGGRAQALKDLANDKANYTDTSGVGTVSRPRVTLDGNLQDDKSRWDGYLPDRNDFQAEINMQETVKFPWKTEYHTRVKHKCFKTSVHADFSTSRIIADKSYRLDVSFKGFTAYKVTFGDWFYPTFVDPKTAQFRPGGQFDSDSFFGLEGSLKAIPATLWVAYKPTLKLTTKTELWKQAYSTAADFDINWLEFMSFRFNFQGEASLKPVDNGNGTTTLTFESPVDAMPQVFGVESQVKYNGSAN
jgi:hypothetical protein